MANLFADLPSPVGNGIGADVDTSGMGREKTITVQDEFRGTINIEISEDGGATFAQIATFTATGKKVLEFAADRMRVRRTGVPTINPGLPNVDVGANDNGALFASLSAAAGDGLGAPVDTSALGTFNTVTVLGTFRGTVNILISDDGVDYATCMSFDNPGVQSKEFTAQFMRVERTSVPGIAPGLPIVAVGAVNDATPGGGAGGSASNCLIFRPGSGLSGSTVFSTWTGLIAQLATLRAANNSDGCYEIQFDDSLASPITIPPGVYDMKNVTWTPSPERSVATFFDILIPEGVVLLRLRKFGNIQSTGILRIECTATVTPPISDIVDGDLFNARGVQFQASGGVPLIEAGALLPGEFVSFFFEEGGTGFGGTGPAINAPTPGSFVLYRFGNDAGLQADTIASVVGSLVFYQLGDDSVFSFNPQPANAGTQIFQVFPRQRWAVDPTPPAPPFVASPGARTNGEVRFDVSGGPVAQTLGPADSGLFPGQTVIFKEVSGTDGLTIVPSGGDTIEGGAVAVVAVPGGGAVCFITDGISNWEILWIFRGADKYSPPEKWTQNNVAASQASVDLSALVSTSFDTIKAIRAGSIVGLSTRFTEAITDAAADSARIAVTINGATGALFVTHSSGTNPSGGEKTQAPGIDTFVAGDLIGVEITTLGTFAPTTTDLESWIDMELA